ncbi:hypothetical protein ACFYTF_18240 [Nocardia thailandica]|uniref:Uncharacterized protein n=1 Tax=Nocardia thailandica TaxID=257275 RepID=A0ABW6PR01_9NOCA
MLEAAIADWARSGIGREAQIRFETDPPGSTTPETVSGEVRLIDGNGNVYRHLPVYFSNRGGNSFERRTYGIELGDFNAYTGDHT